MFGKLALRRPSAVNLTARQSGVSLLEVLIAVLVLAVGVLGAVLLQTNALRYSASAAAHTQATFIAYDMLDRMRANPTGLPNYATNVTAGCSAASSSASSSASILATDLADFSYAVSCLLPVGHGQVAINGQRATVTLAWSEERIIDGGGETSLEVSALIRSDP